MDYANIAEAFRAFATGFTLLAETLDSAENSGNQEPAGNLGAPDAGREEKKETKKPPVKKDEKVKKDETPEDSRNISLEDLQELGRRVIKTLGAPALSKVLKSHGLKNLSSADPEDYQKLYADIDELINDWLYADIEEPTND